MRLLITASRTYTNRDAIAAVIHLALADAVAAGGSLDVDHGGAKGGDTLAELVVRALARDGLPVTSEVFRPDYAADPWRAPLVRNAVMVARRPDRCVAFVMPCAKPGCRRTEPHWSHGADDCATRAETAGIPTVRIGVDGREVAR